MNRNDQAITRFAMLGHATFHTYELSIPIFIVAWLHTFGVSEATLGLVVGVGYAFIGIGALPSGIGSDIYGSKSLVVVSIFGMGVGFLLISVASNVWVLTGALIVWGAAASVYHPAGVSLLTQATDEQGTALGNHGAAGNIGTVLGPLVAAILLGFLNWHLVAGLFVLPALIMGLVAMRIEFDTPAPSRLVKDFQADGGKNTITGLHELITQSRVLFTSGFVLVFAIEIFYGLFYRGVLTFLPNILGHLGVFSSIPVFGVSFAPGRYLYTGVLLIGIVGQYLGGKLSDAVTVEYVLIGVYTALFVVSLLFIPAEHGSGLELVGECAVLGFLLYLVIPTTQSAVAKYTGSNTHGLSFGYVYLAMFGIGAVGSVVAGSVLTYLSISGLFVVLAGFAGICGLLSVRLFTGARSFGIRPSCRD